MFILDLDEYFKSINEDKIKSIIQFSKFIKIKSFIYAGYLCLVY